MPDAFQRQVTLERNFVTAAFALSDAGRRAAIDAAPLRVVGLSPRDIAETLGGLEAVYTVRLFSEFEGTLRSVARALWPTQKTTRTVRTLIDRIAARHHVVADVLDAAHAVRRYRNAIVHRSPWGAPPTLAECRSDLATFLSYLPRKLLA